MSKTLVTTLAALAGVSLATALTTAPATALVTAPATAEPPPLKAPTAQSPAQSPVQSPVQRPVQSPVQRPAQRRDRSPGAASSPLMRPGRAARYWTPGKQAKAKAAALPLSTTGLDTAAQSAADHSAADHSAAERLSVPGAKRLTPGGDANGYAPVRRPYTADGNSRATGRLFFVNATGRDDSCSASVVRSASRLLVITAAHCVYSSPDGSASGTWHTNFAFVPAYDGRAATAAQREPYGRWGGRRAWKPDAYTGRTGGDWNSVYDVALVEVGGRNRTLQDTVGAFTPLRNEGGRFTIATSGYPGVLGRRPYDGRDQLWCLGRTQQARGENTTGDMLAARLAGTGDPAGRMETYNCHLAKGHSGGPWVVRGSDDLVGVLSAGKEDGEPDGNSVATALNAEGYGAIVRQADPKGVYDSLSLDAAGPGAPVRRGGTATVTATVTMRGLMAAAQVPVTLTLPTGATLTSVDGATCRHGDHRAECVIDVIHPGRPVRISAKVAVGRDADAALPAALPVTMHVTSTRLDPAQRDNSAVLRLRTATG
ncbi:trypsin-like peptidase domain-containing protein [Nonomuraea sp. NPDC001636]|uniref:trypsin-like peptidase domain-containing protein n=1 Tax=Nonomuraea sp. NPDC001636 TaxID=3154391 RepID=UPI0033281C3D